VPELLKFATIGFFQGAVYGLLGVGIVLVYKGTRVFNFAQAEFGTVAALILFALHQNAHMNYLLAVIIALVCVVLIGLIVERLVIRPLLNAPRLTLIVATVGVALLLIAVELIVAGTYPRNLDPAWRDPTGAGIHPSYVNVFGVGIERQQFLIVIVLAALAVGLAYFFNRTHRGLALRATSEDSMASRVVGISVVGTSRFIWGSAALLGGVAGILYAPITVLTPAFMTGAQGIEVLIPAFTAAVLGGMTSVAGAFIGGLLVGIVQNVGIYYGQKAGVSGAPELSVFLLLILVLLVRPQGLLGREA
jgi:branched-chain amino acid transport system permease protein